MRILIVDDQPSNIFLLRYLLEQDGHECIDAEDGAQAVSAFEQHAPDFVLLDVVMPVMDGYEAAKKIKELSKGHHVPIIFLTAQTEQASLIQCLDNGDDYLVKPVNEILLKAKINAHSRTQELTMQINTKNEELTVLHQTLQHEHDMGQHVLSHALQRSWNDCPNVRSYLSSMTTFNGDLFLVAPNPNGGLYAFLGDMTGHGLAAAIGAVPVSQTFFAMCQKAKSVRDIAAELNLALKSFLPSHMFCAAAIIDINQQADTLKIWTGGLPSAYIIRPGKGVVTSLQSKHLPLGILEPEEFDREIQSYLLRSGDRLLLMTDGILEAQHGDGTMFGEERLLAAVGAGDAGYFDRLLRALAMHCQGLGQQDDVSLVELLSQPIASQVVQLDNIGNSMPWTLSFHFSPELLKNSVDPLGDMLLMIPSDTLISRCVDAIQIVLAELFSNALEHGVLKLDSSMKSTSDGFAEFYRLRSAQLASLTQGGIEISLAFDPGMAGRELSFKVEDTGEGFEYEAVDITENYTAWGRGLSLVTALSQEIHFSKNGSCVEVWLSIAP